MNRNPMPIWDHSTEQVLAILELLETLHNANRDAYALQLHEYARAELAELTEEEDRIDAEEDAAAGACRNCVRGRRAQGMAADRLKGAAREDW